MDTFTPPRDFVDNARYGEDRAAALAALYIDDVDKPIVGLTSGFNALPHCFTVQSCYGHFLTGADPDPCNLDPVPARDSGPIRYRIAYVALCLENSATGRSFRESLAQIPEFAPDYLQFGSADWFWERWVNSYVLQVEPAAYATHDQAVVTHEEALRIQGVRDLFFLKLEELVEVWRGRVNDHGPT